MGKRSKPFCNSSTGWRRVLSPWKAGLSLFAFGLWFGTLLLLDFSIPGTINKPVFYVENEELVFIVKSVKTALLEMYFFPGFFLWAALVFWWFWPEYSQECDQRIGRLENEFTESRFATIAMYLLLGVLASFFLLCVCVFAFLIPLKDVHRVTVQQDEVKLESLYRSWNISRDDLRQVVFRRKVVEDGYGGPHVDYQAEIQIANGSLFRTVEIQARPPDGAKDMQYTEFFAKLKEKLVKK